MSLYDLSGRMRYPDKGAWQSNRFKAVTRDVDVDQKYLMDEFRKQNELNLELEEWEDSYDEQVKDKPQTSAHFVAAPYSPSPSASEENYQKPQRPVKSRGINVEHHDSLQKDTNEQTGRPPLKAMFFSHKSASAVLRKSPRLTENDLHWRSLPKLRLNREEHIEGEVGVSAGHCYQKKGFCEEAEDNVDLFTLNGVSVPYTQKKKKTRKQPLGKRTILPNIEKYAKIDIFKKKFPGCLPTSVVMVGKWRIPVHTVAIKGACPALAEKMIETRDMAELKKRTAAWKPYRDPEKPRRKAQRPKPNSAHRWNPRKKTDRYDIRKRLQELKQEREQGKKTARKRRKPDGVNVFKIDAPARSVIEFLNYVYPHQELRMATLLTSREVFGLARLCVEYDVCDERVLEHCVKRLRVLFSKENLQDVLSLLDDKLLKELKEFEQEVAEKLGTMLIEGEISNQELTTICPKTWRLVLSATVWNEGLSKQVNYGRLIAQVLSWVINSMDGVTPDFLVEMMNTISGFHVNSESCRYRVYF
jgi:hypothetical protein